VKIKQALDPAKLFFASDYHFCHRNIIEFQNRPFSDVNEMNGFLIAAWNNVVPTDATVFYLGDFTFGPSKSNKWIRDSLNGQHIHFILGNHDREKEIKALGFASISVLVEISVIDNDNPKGYQKIIMSHYPILSWNGMHKGNWHLFGHCHGNLDHPHPHAIDVGADNQNYEPVSYGQIKKQIIKRAATKPFVPIDHHR